jgi:hypothetical protein
LAAVAIAAAASLAALLYAIPREGAYAAVAGMVTGVLLGVVFSRLAFRRGSTRASATGEATYRSAWLAFVIVLAAVPLYVWQSKDPAAVPLGAGFLIGVTIWIGWSALHRRTEAS